MLVFPVAVHTARYYDDLAIEDARAPHPLMLD
jgi:hypothetical protein